MSAKRKAELQARSHARNLPDKRGRKDPAQLESELRAANRALRDQRKANAALKEKCQEQKTHLKDTQAELKKHQKHCETHHIDVGTLPLRNIDDLTKPEQREARVKAFLECVKMLRCKMKMPLTDAGNELAEEYWQTFKPKENLSDETENREADSEEVQSGRRSGLDCSN
jgi:predicted nuclease with TOPRIM domain